MPSADRCAVTVTVRVRPILIRREEAEGEGATCVSVNGNCVTIWDPADMSRKRAFSYDRAFDSISTDHPQFAAQPAVYSVIGVPTLEQAFKGYNTTIFAYGQTGSGKTYTMLGHEAAPLGITDSAPRDRGASPGEQQQVNAEVGIIPRFCLDLFRKVEESNAAQTTVSHRVDCVYYEIYNERVHDLLDPSGAQAAHRVREHPHLGPYVEGLQRLQVRNYAEVAKVLRRGAKERHTASTNMNDHSSRSHAVCELTLTSSKFDRATGDLSETVSRICLVDLAGSERQRAAGTQGDRLREGATINKSLLTLGNVIEALASNSEKSRAPKRFVPYRDATLTWLLREALGGNSKTVMVATISPSTLNFEESLSTLKYADRAKKIQNQATVNRDSKKEIIFALREEIRLLKAEIDSLRSGGGNQVVRTLDWGGPSDEPCGEAHHGWVPQPRSPTAAAGHEGSPARLLSVTKAEPYLLQIEPVPAVGDTVMWSLGASCTYVSCRDHSLAPGSRLMALEQASSAAPLHCAQRTIVLPRTRGVLPYHCLFVSEGPAVLVHPTRGSPYDGRIRTQTSAAETPQSPGYDDDGDFQVLVDGTPAIGGERLNSGAHLKLGSYEFIFADPRQAEEPDTGVSQRLRCLERAKEQSERSAQAAARRVAAILAQGGVDIESLPSEAEALRAKGAQGDEVIVRGPHGRPAVYVWANESPDDTPRPEGRQLGAAAAAGGCWRPADHFEAELAAARAAERRKAEVERGRKLTTMLVDCVDLDSLPHERDLPSRPEGRAAGETHLVRCESAGLRVVQWDKQRKRWQPVSDAVAELTARQLKEKRQRDHRAHESGRALQELRDKAVGADTMRQELAESRARQLALEERHKAELERARERELELQEELNRKDAMLRKHTDEAHSSLARAQRELALAASDYETRLAERQHICATLEDQLGSATYEWKKHEALLEASQGAKQKLMDQARKLREELSERAAETDALRAAVEKAKAEAAAGAQRVQQVEQQLAERDKEHRERTKTCLQMAAVSVSVQEQEDKISDLLADLQQVRSNRDELSAKWLKTQEQLVEQVSRNSQRREELEALERERDAERDRARELQRALGDAQRERDDVAARLQRVLEQTRKREEADHRKAQLEDLKRRLQGLEEAKRQAEGCRSFAEQTASKERQKSSDLQSRLRDTTQEYKKLKEVLEQSNEKSDRLRQQLRERGDEVSSLRMQLQAYKSPQVAGQQHMSAADALRKVSELTIQLEMSREKCQSLEHRLNDAVMMSKHREEGTMRMGQLKETKEEEIKRLKDQLMQTRESLQATQARLDRKTEQVQRLTSEKCRFEAQLKHLEGKDREASPPPAGRKTSPYGLSFPAEVQRLVTVQSLSTPRDAPQGHRSQVRGGAAKRSHSQDSKASKPNYARPTDSWAARVDEDTPARVSTPPHQVPIPQSARRPSDAARSAAKRKGAVRRTAGGALIRSQSATRHGERHKG
eukprot:TRINITY_DN3488_c0_g1_i2.p1 TRINITY_DN3488_c0_g1~~TRINITY_DN3488_c0_g1_i2.p1  ORF type:complete len:1506 (+),score=626.38 TRINITY_DN3488_c0_g1_i2:91-4518(+)